MRCRFVLLVLSGLSLLVLPARAAQPSGDRSLQSDYLAVYLKMNDALKMEGTGDDRGALTSYEDCYSRLQKMHSDYPKWESALVLSRMSDCKASIMALEAKLNVQKPKPAPEAQPATAVAADSPKARLGTLEQAVKNSPDSAPAIFNLGAAYYQVGQTDRAIAMLQRGLALEPNNIYAHNFLGCAFLRKGRIDSAAKEFLKTLAIDESYADGHYNLAILYATEDPPATKSASAQYKRAMELGIAPDPHLEKVLRVPKSASATITSP